MLSSQFSNIRRTQFDQSSPVQPVSDFRGGSTSVTEKDEGRTKEILVSNIGLFILELQCQSLLYNILHSEGSKINRISFDLYFFKDVIIYHLIPIRANIFSLKIILVKSMITVLFSCYFIVTFHYTLSQCSLQGKKSS